MGFIRNGQPLRAGKAFTDEDGTQYPKNWATVFNEEQKAALGITWEPDPAPVDTRFYWSAENPKRLEDEPAVDENGDAILDANGEQVINRGLKSEWVAKQKEIAGTMLASTDWYVTRKAETGTEIPADVSAYREAVRTISGTREGEINACTTPAELVALVTNPSTIRIESGELDEFGVAIMTTVTNTEPFITPWPEAL